jgi:hypothetical protein
MWAEMMKKLKRGLEGTHTSVRITICQASHLSTSSRVSHLRPRSWLLFCPCLHRVQEINIPFLLMALQFLLRRKRLLGQLHLGALSR